MIIHTALLTIQNLSKTQSLLTIFPYPRSHPLLKSPPPYINPRRFYLKTRRLLYSFITTLQRIVTSSTTIYQMTKSITFSQEKSKKIHPTQPSRPMTHTPPPHKLSLVQRYWQIVRHPTSQ